MRLLSPLKHVLERLLSQMQTEILTLVIVDVDLDLSVLM